MKDAYFSSLVGRSVQLHRGGPNSHVGKLLDVSEDYLAIQNEDGEIVYFKKDHIKSISESSQSRFNVTTTETTNESTVTNTNKVTETEAELETTEQVLLKAASFAELAVNFKEQTVRINGQGPESKVGKMLDVKSDFLILHDDEDGLTFYNAQHIKSLSFADTETEDEESEDGDSNSENAEQTQEALVTQENNLLEVYSEIAADNSLGILGNLKYCWVKINRKGPECVEGMLVDADEDHLVLVVKDEVIRIATYHVKSFSVTVNYQQDQSNNQDSNNENSSNQNSNNQNSNNQNSNNDKSNNQNSTDKNQAYQNHLNQMVRIKRRRMKNRAQQQNKGTQS